MKLADKRRVIEVLLCAGGTDETLGIGDICLLDDAPDLFAFAVASRKSACGLAGHARRSTGIDCYEDDCLEAAYLMIESSSALRREWFGAR